MRLSEFNILTFTDFMTMSTSVGRDVCSIKSVTRSHDDDDDDDDFCGVRLRI
jgi:hypothetical protein